MHIMDAFGNSIDQYDVYEELGRGGFAVVYRAICRKSGVEVAIKMIDRIQIKAAKMSRRVSQEVEIHSRLQHPSILQLFTFFEDTSYVYLVLELCQNGELQSYLKTHNRILPEPEACTIMKQIVEGLLYLHSHRIIHRDITLANLLLTKDMNIKIADFGLAIQLQRADQKQMTMCGTPNYISPEVATRGSHGLETDVWGLGIIMYTLLVGKPPFETADGLKSTLTMVVMSEIKFPLYVSLEAKDLIKALLQKNPKERITLKNILEHPFILKSQQQQTNSMVGPLKRCMSYDSGVATASSYMTCMTSSQQQPCNSYTHVSNCGGSLVHSCRFNPPRNNNNNNNPGFSTSSQQQQHHQQHSGICSENNCSLAQRPIKHCSHTEQCDACTPPVHAAVINSCCSNPPKFEDNRRSRTDVVYTQQENKSGASKTTGRNSKNGFSNPPANTLKISVSPVSAKRLRPVRQKAKNVVCSILSTSDVCLEFLRQIDGHERVWEVMRISSDGMRIIMYHPKKGRGVHVAESPPPMPTAGADTMYNYENIPEKHWKKYCYAHKFVDLVKRRTPKITYYSPLAKCYLMENIPVPDFQACFYQGGKICKSESSITITLTSGKSWTFDIFDIPIFPNDVEFMWEHFRKCLDRCETLHQSMCELGGEGSSSSDEVFPVIFGKRPQSQNNSPLQPSNRNQENMSPQSVVNIPSMQGYETSIAHTKLGLSNKKVRYPS